jgi:hypothetical protein
VGRAGLQPATPCVSSSHGVYQRILLNSEYGKSLICVEARVREDPPLFEKFADQIADIVITKSVCKETRPRYKAIGFASEASGFSSGCQYATHPGASLTTWSSEVQCQQDLYAEGVSVPPARYVTVCSSCTLLASSLCRTDRCNGGPNCFL